MKKIIILLGLFTVLFASCKDEETVIVKDIKISPKEVNIVEGDTKKLSIEINPSNAENKNISWSVIDSEFASVNGEGELTALKQGETYVIAKADNGVKGSAKVIILQKEVPIEKVVVEPKEMTIVEGGSEQLNALIYPQNTTEDYSVELISSNPEIAIIDDYGMVWGQSKGECDITVKVTDDDQAVCHVTVIEPDEYVFAIPNKKIFEDRGYVQKVMKKDEQIAQICLEYIVTDKVKEQLLVAYPIVEGKPDLTKGVCLDNGSAVSWDMEENTCNYTSGTLEPKTLKFAQGKLAISETAEETTNLISMIPDKIYDKRSNDVQNYRIVKVGTQYWMAENLRAEHSIEGEELLNITDNKEWQKNTFGCFCYPDCDEANKVTFGNLYNHLAIENYDLAPKGYHVTTTDDWFRLAKYLSPSTFCDDPIGYETYNFGVIAPEVKSKKEWFVGEAWGKQIDGNGNNLTGLNIVPCGTRYPSGELYHLIKYAIYWTVDKDSEKTAFFVRFLYDEDYANYYMENVNQGMGIRCVKN